MNASNDQKYILDAVAIAVGFTFIEESSKPEYTLEEDQITYIKNLIIPDYLKNENIEKSFVEDSVEDKVIPFQDFYRDAFTKLFKTKKRTRESCSLDIARECKLSRGSLVLSGGAVVRSTLKFIIHSMIISCFVYFVYYAKTKADACFNWGVFSPFSFIFRSTFDDAYCVQVQKLQQIIEKVIRPMIKELNIGNMIALYGSGVLTLTAFLKTVNHAVKQGDKIIDRILNFVLPSQTTLTPSSATTLVQTQIIKNDIEDLKKSFKTLVDLLQNKTITVQSNQRLQRTQEPQDPPQNNNNNAASQNTDEGPAGSQGSRGGSSKTIMILGRKRKINKVGRTCFITYNKKQISLTEARKIEKQISTKKKNIKA